jgi:sporulation protein YlmC with PRC-barrel domain
MFRLSKTITDIDVLSLRTAAKVATATEPIINPHNLKVEGWFCEDVFSKEKLVLLAQDVRDFVPQGIAVNDHEVLSTPEELVRLQDILKLEFNLLGKPVVTNHKRRLGKVADYALDTDTLVIQKLYVARPMYRSITAGQLSIDHSQIIEINDRAIIVREADIKVGAPVTTTAPVTS